MALTCEERQTIYRESCGLDEQHIDPITLDLQGHPKCKPCSNLEIGLTYSEAMARATQLGVCAGNRETFMEQCKWNESGNGLHGNLAHRRVAMRRRGQEAYCNRLGEIIKNSRSTSSKRSKSQRIAKVAEDQKRATELAAAKERVKEAKVGRATRRRTMRENSKNGDKSKSPVNRTVVSSRPPRSSTSSFTVGFMGTEQEPKKKNGISEKKKKKEKKASRKKQAEKSKQKKASRKKPQRWRGWKRKTR